MYFSISVRSNSDIRTRLSRVHNRHATGSSSIKPHTMAHRRTRGTAENSTVPCQDELSRFPDGFEETAIYGTSVMLKVVRRLFNPKMFLQPLDHPQKWCITCQTRRTKTTAQMPSATASTDEHVDETANLRGDIGGSTQIIHPNSVSTATGSSSTIPHSMAHRRTRGTAENSTVPCQDELSLFPDGFEETAIYGTSWSADHPIQECFSATGSSSIKPHTMAHHRRRGPAENSTVLCQDELSRFPDGFEETAIYGTSVMLKVVRRLFNPKMFLQPLDHPQKCCRSVSKWSDVPFLTPLSACGEQLPRNCWCDCLHLQPDDTSTTSQLETLVDVFHHLDDFDDRRNCLQTSRVVVEVRREGGLLSCLWPALDRLLEQTPGCGELI
ncbi:hypothetical protein T11_14655 [Trichinella zimbabwensis]|uniref:Uncharacterized protein n=1 Tax=Trichinella zimbabwensis TaxID=268475 RepID=A0A0V1HSH3_9BILA|nr:hypothetical protein T11_14655 [Trichinella zimbabwensis]